MVSIKTCPFDHNPLTLISSSASLMQARVGSGGTSAWDGEEALLGQALAQSPQAQGERAASRLGDARVIPAVATADEAAQTTAQLAGIQRRQRCSWPASSCLAIKAQLPPGATH